MAQAVGSSASDLAHCHHTVRDRCKFPFNSCFDAEACYTATGSGGQARLWSPWRCPTLLLFAMPWTEGVGDSYGPNVLNRVWLLGAAWPRRQDGQIYQDGAASRASQRRAAMVEPVIKANVCAVGSRCGCFTALERQPVSLTGHAPLRDAAHARLGHQAHPGLMFARFRMLLDPRFNLPKGDSQPCVVKATGSNTCAQAVMGRPASSLSMQQPGCTATRWMATGACDLSERERVAAFIAGA